MKKTNREIFERHIAPTSLSPLGLEIVKASGSTLEDVEGKKYTDLVAGFSVQNLGHSHPAIIRAIEEQARKYLHVIAYGEFILEPQVELTRSLLQILPQGLDSLYYLSSGTEAVETAIKLAKRASARPEVISFQNAYHGSTQGSLSMMGDEKFRSRFRPLIPGITQLFFNNPEELHKISTSTACVIVEPIQGEAGIIMPEDEYLIKLRKRCDDTGALLIFDEIQTGFGRTGHLFASNKYNVIPDILVLGKALGGGMPLAAIAAPKELTKLFASNPILGHITTFGGHPISCVAGNAFIDVLIKENIIKDVEEKGLLFKKLLTHHHIREVRGCGLFLAVELDKRIKLDTIIHSCIANGVLIDYFIHASSAFRITPPLTISREEITQACNIINKVLEEN